MKPDAWLVNVARGAVVDTAALVQALQREQIGGAALDVTDPEPLPAGHRLWDLDNCLITPHTADTEEMTQPLLADRIADNVRRLAAGQDLVGGPPDPLDGGQHPVQQGDDDGQHGQQQHRVPDPPQNHCGLL